MRAAGITRPTRYRTPDVGIQPGFRFHRCPNNQAGCGGAGPSLPLLAPAGESGWVPSGFPPASMACSDSRSFLPLETVSPGGAGSLPAKNCQPVRADTLSRPYKTTSSLLATCRPPTLSSDGTLLTTSKRFKNFNPFETAEKVKVPKFETDPSVQRARNLNKLV